MINKQPLRVYYDNSIFALQKIGGISIVFGEIIKRLKKISGLQLNFIVNGDGRSNEIFRSVSGGINKIQELRLSKFILPFFPLMRILPAGSIYHTTYTRYSFQKNIKKVITIHDLGYEHKIMRAGMRRVIHLFFKKIAIKNADAIICVSQNTMDDLHLFYGHFLGQKAVKVIYNGLSEEFLSFERIPHQRSEKEILFVGARYGYKNFEETVMAVNQLDGYRLLVAGGGQLTSAHQMLLDLHLPLRYEVMYNISTAELRDLYLRAFCLVYPSSYEGFGLPLLEAMASGCPVIACDNSCISEIANGAAVLIDKPEVSEIKDAISKLADENLRQELINKGKLNSKNFSWEKTAQLTLQLYKNLMHNNK